MPKATQIKEQEREVVWPELVSRIFITNPPPCPPGCPEMYWPYRPPLTVAAVKEILGWETEKEYAARVVAENPKAKPAQCTFSKPTSTNPFLEPLLTDINGDKVRCWKNLSNRDFDMNRALSYAQDQLNGRWRINGENIIIGRHDNGISLQHRLIGFVLADQMRERDERWKAIHPEPLLLETFAALGVSEDQATVNTIDNTLARSMADTIKTAHLFDAWTVNDKRPIKGSDRFHVVARLLDNGEKRKCARMLAKATELLWDRVGAGNDEFHGYRTHSESAAFRDRHPRLLECVRHIFEEDAGHAIGLLGLSAGQSAACLYLMGCADSDAERYHGGDAPLDEKNLTWDRWDLARQFWADLASGKLEAVREVLANPFALEVATEANGAQKLCILAKAWGVYLAGKKPTVAQLTLKPLMEDGVIRGVDEKPKFGNADLGPAYEAPEPGSEDEMLEEANRRGVPVSKVLEERRTKVHVDEIAKAQAKIDKIEAERRAKARLFKGELKEPAPTGPEVEIAATTLPVATKPTHPIAKRAPLGTGGKLPTAPVAAKKSDGQPPGVTVVRPAGKIPPPKTGPTKPSSLRRTV